MSTSTFRPFRFLVPSALISTAFACAPAEPAQTAAPASVPAEPPPAAAAPAPAEPAPAPRHVVPRVLETRGSFLEPLPTAVTSFGVAGDAQRIYVLGGYAGVPHAYSKKGQSDEVWGYAPNGKDGWKKLGAMKQALQGLAAVSYAGKLCHFGGSHASNEVDTPTVMTSVTDAACFDPAKNEWTELPALPAGRSSHAAALVGSTVYVVGGWTLSGNAQSGVFADEAFALDLAQPQKGWSKLPVPFARRALGLASIGKKLVVVGGMTSEGKPSAAVDIYDTVTKKWSSGPDFPGDAFGIAVTAKGALIYASGRDGQLKSLSPGKKTWQDVKTLGYGRFFHQLVPVGDDLVVLGGIGGMHTRGRTRAVERISLAPGLRYGQLVLEYPGLAKNRQGILPRGEEFLLFGGNDSLEQHDFDREHFVAESWIFDLATLEYHEAPAFPYRRQSMVVVPTAAGGVALGGFGHEPSTDPRSDAVSHDEVLTFDWESATWGAPSHLPRGRTQFGATLQDRELWIFGGLNYDPNRKGPQAFDHDRSLWQAPLGAELRFATSEVSLPGPRRAFAGAEFGGKYVLIGGMKDGFELVDDCLEFDFTSKRFDGFPCPAARLSGDLIPAGGKLYLVGGSVRAKDAKDGVSESRRIDVYDPKTRKWSDAGIEIPFTTRHLRAFPYREQILLLSTHNAEGKLFVGLISP
ncbi:MAG TPA: hypothetical protein VLC09_01795 [Polyangiaceae bacterium]|nr:hypothetical protein [Polyangiaceae bacterium]